MFGRISSFRAPPGLVLLYNLYLLSVFIVSLYFLYVSHGLFRGQRSLKKSDLINSALSAILWILPAIFSFGTANTYLTDPRIPLDIRAHWVHYLWTGIFFGVIGVMNMASIYCLTRRKKVFRQKFSNAAPE